MVQLYRLVNLLLLFLFGLALFSSVSASVAADCVTDPRQCTPKMLCEVATEFNGSIPLWSTDPRSAKHVKLAQSFDAACGVIEIIDPCDTDASKCTINQICAKATSEISGQKIWNSNALLYVVLAKDYGLSCEVKAPTTSLKQICNGKSPQGCSDTEVCELLDRISMPTTFLNDEVIRRDINCGETFVEALNFRQAYISQPKLRRQQLQYALKNLGYYFYDTDGLWGKGTSFAFDKFIAAYALQNNSEGQVFSRLLKKVTVPLSFETPKKVKSAATLIKQPPTEDNLASGEAEPISPDVEQSITKGEPKVLTAIEDKIIYPVIGILKNVIKGVCVGLNAAGSGEPDC